jgi:hypothetical protein
MDVQEIRLASVDWYENDGGSNRTNRYPFAVTNPGSILTSRFSPSLVVVELL